MTAYRIFITPAALLDIEDAVAYYNDKQENLGEMFSSVVDNGLQRIAKFPTAYGYRYNKVRGKFLRRFPYLILFQIEESSRTIQIIRIFNTHQNPERYKR